jgi:hypothetical protein
VVLDALLSEKQWMAQVVELAKTLGWKVFHAYDSRRSEPGFPDLVLVKPPSVIFVELKKQDGKVTKPQKIWLDALQRSRNVQAYLWRPSDWDWIQGVLR